MFGLGTTELLIILVVLLLLFGSRLPNVMRSLGRSATEFKRGLNEVTDEVLPEDKHHQESDVKDQAPSDQPPAG